MRGEFLGETPALSRKVSSTRLRVIVGHWKNGEIATSWTL